MKNLSVLCVLFAFTIALTCCKKEDDLPNGSTGSVTFKFDTTKAFNSSFSGGVWEPNNGILNITAKFGKSIIVMNTLMSNGLKTGTYTFNNRSAAGTITFFREDTTKTSEGYYSNIDVQTSGVLTLTNITADSLITGTFKFTLKDPVTGKTKLLDNGVITNVKAVNNKSIVTGGSNTFSAKIDGVLWSPKQIFGTKSIGKIIITASDGTKSIGLQLVETVKTGTYTMDFGGDYGALYNPTNSTTNPESYVASTATSKLTISEHNTTNRQIKGSFNFKGELFLSSSTKSYLITEGVFSVKY